jgi:hypothetical protein
MATITQIPSKKKVMNAERTSPSAAEPDPQNHPHHHVYAAEVSVEPEHEQIALLAHSYWLNRGPGEGSAEEDWFRAEREIRERPSAQKHSSASGD